MGFLSLQMLNEDCTQVSVRVRLRGMGRFGARVKDRVRARANRRLGLGLML